MAGWIKLYRSIEANDFLNDEPYDKRSAWVWLLLHANTEPHKIKYRDGRTRTIKRGQLHTSIRNLATTWGWGRERVSIFLDNLESQKMIRTKRDKNGTLLTIEKYTSYQGAPATVDATNGATTEARYKKKEEVSTSALPLGSVPSALTEDNDPRYKQLKVVDADVL